MISHHVSFCSTYCSRTALKQLTPFFLARSSLPPPLNTARDSCTFIYFLHFSEVSFFHPLIPFLTNKQPVILHFSICPDFFLPVLHVPPCSIPLQECLHPNTTCNCYPFLYRPLASEKYPTCITFPQFPFRISTSYN